MNEPESGVMRDKSRQLEPRTWFGLAVWLLMLIGWMGWSQWLPTLLAVPVAIAVAGASALVCVGSSELMRTARVVNQSFKEDLRDPRETLESIMVLAEHSRRNGILGLADVEINWPPLAKACHLVATAADAAQIRREARVATHACSHRSDGTIFTLALASVCVVVTGACLFVLSQVGGNAHPAVGWAALAASLLVVAGVFLPSIARLATAKNRELACLMITYEGAVNMLNDNNMESVYRELEAYIPGGL